MLLCITFGLMNVWLFLIASGAVGLIIFSRLKQSGVETSNIRLMLLIWGFKCLGALSFYCVFFWYYGEGKMWADDSGAFLAESAQLANLAKTDWSHFKQIFFGLNEESINTFFQNQPKCRYCPDNNGFFSSTRWHIRWLTLLQIVCAEIWFVLLVLNLLLFHGLSRLFLILQKKNRNHPLLFLVILVSPSIAVWGSGVGKEFWLLLALSHLVASSFKLLQNAKKNVNQWWVVLLAILLLFLFKWILITALLLGFSLAALYYFLQGKSKITPGFWIVFMMILTLFILFRNDIFSTFRRQQLMYQRDATAGWYLEKNDTVFFLPEGKPYFKTLNNDTVSLTSDVRTSYYVPPSFERDTNSKLPLHQGDTLVLKDHVDRAESTYEKPLLEENGSNILSVLKASFVNGFFRPFPHSKTLSIKDTLFFLESLVYFLLLAFVLIKSNKVKATNVLRGMAIGSMIYILLIGGVLSNTGSLLRYKMPAVFVIAIAAWYLYGRLIRNKKYVDN